MTRARELRGTAEALEAYRRGSGRVLAGGDVLIALGIGLGAFWPGSEWRGQLAAWLVGTGVVAIGTGIGARAHTRRFRRVLGSGVWTAHRAVAVPPGVWSAEAVVLAGGPDGEELWPLRVVALRHRWAPYRPGRGAVMWWCGDPGRGGVLAPPGGGALFWTKPVRGAAARRRIVARASAEGLAGPPVPPPMPPLPAGALPPGPEPDAAERRKERRRLLTGRWRWLVVVAAAVFAVNWNWVGAQDADPQIDLTVVSEEPDGSCVVRWKDPWSGTDRSGPYRCDPGRGEGLVGVWETGFVVSYGPWKGELYGYDAAGELHGSQALDTVDSIALAASGGFLVGLVGGWATFWTRWHRRRRAAREAREAWEAREAQEAALRAPASAPASPPVSLVKAPAAEPADYARFAAYAERQAVPRNGSPRPEADVREVPWWRVRSLRRWSGVHEALVMGGGVLGLALAAVFAPADVSRGQMFVFLVIGGAVLVRSVFRLLTAGLPSVRLLVRAATAPVPVVRRYALLHDPYGGHPILVLFPDHGGADDRPEGVLPLMSPRSAKRPWEGLPENPVGVVELRGWLDRADSGEPIVVAWHGGRALWPTEPYREAGSAGFAELIGRLAPPAELQEADGS
ncbi:hypothetical protein [Streptomyces sp. NPDC004435]|uniref:hypothetical protein n=1 Tax=Streptomyces sp. NPDC004435 TaxID=3364701 RepID=UPI0036CC167C